MASPVDPDDLAFEMLENMQADVHAQMDRAKAAEAELDKLKKLLAAAQKQLDDPEMVATQVAIDAAGQDGDPFDHCNVCGIDRGHHDCVEGEEPGTCYLVPCEEHLIPVEGAGVVEVSTQTDDAAAEDPDDLASAQTVERLMKQAADAEAQRDEALEKLAAAEEKLAVEPDHNENILAAIRAGWTIPNYFKSDTGDEPQYQEPCWNCPDGNILHINMGITCIKCISTGEEHTVCIHCWHGGFEDDDDWVDMDASSDEDSE